MAVFFLAKQGYGSIEQIREMDTPEFLDLVEYEQISAAVERYHIEKNRREAGK